MRGFWFASWLYACGVFLAMAALAESPECDRSPAVCAIVALGYPAAVTAGAVVVALDYLDGSGGDDESGEPWRAQ